MQYPVLFEGILDFAMVDFLSFEAGGGTRVVAGETVVGIVVFGLQPSVEGTVQVSEVVADVNIYVFVRVLVVVECEHPPMPTLLLLLH